jgi:hypothetical protein
MIIQKGGFVVHGIIRIILILRIIHKDSLNGKLYAATITN